jgi:hypothetical protein
MRGLSLYLSLVPLVFAGCKTPGEKSAAAPSTRTNVAATRVAVATPPAQSEPTPPPPPPEALAVARSVSPEASVTPDHASFAITEEVPAALPPATLPRPLQTCPVDPLLSVLAGSRDEQTQQDAMNVVALMLATGTIRALRSTAGGGSTGGMHRRNVASGIDDVIQTDDDQSAASKAVRPPVLFTLGWKY